jgi:hypothetical protein
MRRSCQPRRFDYHPPPEGEAEEPLVELPAAPAGAEPERACLVLEPE